jgi:predicted RNase H-like HicB family nuclease
MAGDTSRRSEVIDGSSILTSRDALRSADIHAQANLCFHEAAGRAIKMEEMKKLQYLVRIDRDVQSDWGASVPDLPGCVATAKTLDAALRRIEKAIELHLRGMREDGLKPPYPKSHVVTPRHNARWVEFFATVRVAA